MNKKELLKNLESMGMRPGRGLGQNFLLDANLLDWIVRRGAPEPGKPVLEVGPGFGALTSRLLTAGAAVTAVEYDHRIADYLRRTYGENSALKLVEKDACKVDYASLFPEGTEYRAIANLPYSISSVFIARMLELANPPRSMVFMLQREMAERLAAECGTKAYGALSVRVQVRYEVKVAKIVPPTVFYPEPEVESAVAEFILKEKPASPLALKWVPGVVRTAFAQRRKQMGKVLGASYGKARVLSAMAAVELAPEIRPDRVTVDEFLRLAETLAKTEQSPKEAENE